MLTQDQTGSGTAEGLRARRILRRVHLLLVYVSPIVLGQSSAALVLGLGDCEFLKGNLEVQSLAVHVEDRAT